ncbi:hypothetical protein J3F83DRAFT_510048 [Trichoderma novae-zelandiae]
MPRCPRMHRIAAQQFVPLSLAEPVHSTAPCPSLTARPADRPRCRRRSHLSAPFVESTGRRLAAPAQHRQLDATGRSPHTASQKTRSLLPPRAKATKTPTSRAPGWLSLH